MHRAKGAAVKCLAFFSVLGCGLAAQENAQQLPGIGDAIKKRAAEKAIGGLLDSQLPLKLDAKSVYPTVNVLPGGPFLPKPLVLTAETIDQPLPPGDYTVQVLAFCTEYSVHRPGRGLAYELAPLRGKAAEAVATLLWRGTIERRRPAQELQAVAWGIQAGLTYSRMPKSYQVVIDDIIPDYKNQLNGDFIQSIEDIYQSFARGAHLPPLERLLAGMGKPGELALSAKRQREALLRQNTTDELRTQTLFAGQESGVYTPVKAEEGPWTARIPGVAYMRFKIVGGNMASDNVMEIRILPQTGAVAAVLPNSRLVNARYSSPAARAVAQPPNLRDLTSGTVGYPVGAGAQVLVPIPVVATNTYSCPPLPSPTPWKPETNKQCSYLKADSAIASPLYNTLNSTRVTVTTGTADLTCADGKVMTAPAIIITADCPPGACQFIQFVYHPVGAAVTNPNADWDRSDPCNPKMRRSDGTPVADGSNVPPTDCRGEPWTLPRDANTWYLDSRGLGTSGRRSPNFLAGQGTSYCSTPGSLTMFDTPTGAGTEFVTYVICQGRMVAEIHWSVGAGAGQYTWDRDARPCNPNYPNTLQKVRGAKNIKEYDPRPLAPLKCP